MKTHLVFIIQAYKKQEDDGRLTDFTEIQLIDKSVEEAIKRAKSLIKKKHYRLSTIIEKEG